MTSNILGTSKNQQKLGNVLSNLEHKNNNNN